VRNKKAGKRGYAFEGRQKWLKERWGTEDYAETGGFERGTRQQ